ncbi:MAG: HEAT repeat domain-containing protein [Spirochaetota bacterium]
MKKGRINCIIIRMVVSTVSAFLLLLTFAEQTVEANEKCPDAIINNVLSNNNEIHENALGSINRNQPEGCIKKLVEVVVSGKQNEAKIRAIQGLRQYNNNRMIKIWMSLLDKTDSFIIKKQIIQSLANMKNRSVVPELIPLLRSPFFTVRESAASALSKYGDDRVFPFIISMSKDDNPVYRMYAIEAMMHIYDSRLYYMLMSLLNDQNKSIRYAVLECIQENSIDKGLPHVRKAAMNDDNHEVRVRAMNLLSDFNDSRSYSIFVRNLSDEHEQVRDAAVMALNRLGYRKSAWPLSRQLVKETEQHVKLHIIQTLAAIRETGDVRGLGSIIEDDPGVVLRIEAACALGIIGENKGIPFLLKALDDDEYRVRAEAACALGVFQGSEVVTSLLRELEKDNNRYVRSAVLYSLQKIGDTGALLGLYRIYCVEKDPVMKALLDTVIKEFIRKTTREYGIR